MTNLLIQYYRKNKEMVLYLIFGVLTTAVNYVSYFILTRAVSMKLAPANIIAWALAVAFAYATNRKWVFESKVVGTAIIKEMCFFVFARIFSGIVDTVSMVTLVEYLYVDDMVSKIFVSILVILINYILSKLLVFQ